MNFKISDYDVEGVIGEGGFALIQKCRHRDSGEWIALKKLKKETRDESEYQDRLRREILLLERLKGVPCVIELLGHSGESNHPKMWYAMPMAATNLHEFIRKNNNNLKEDDRVRLFRQVLEAIQTAHDQGILHRDISPSNALLLDRENLESVVVSDFGLGRDIASDATYTRSSAANYGHAYYVAPEQRDKLKSATVKSDIYSLGKLLNFAMTGKDPDHHYPCSLSSVIQRATHPEPDQRHQTVALLRKHFEQMVNIRTGPVPLPRTMAGALDIGDSVPDWNQIHDSLINPKYDDHPYHDYLDPVIKFFSEPGRLAEYFSAIAGGEVQFAEAFVKELNDCFGTVGWPFNDTGRFADFLHKIFLESTASQTRGICLKELWDIAFGADQWGAQRTMIALLSSGQIGDAEEMTLANHILETNKQVEDGRLMQPQIPAVIRRVLAQIQG